MAQIDVRVHANRKRGRKQPVVGYRWYGDREFEILGCGHEVPTGVVEDAYTFRPDMREILDTGALQRHCYACRGKLSKRSKVRVTMKVLHG